MSNYLVSLMEENKKLKTDIKLLQERIDELEQIANEWRNSCVMNGWCRSNYPANANKEQHNEPA
jgi:regulator of replication initiation timing